MADSTVLAEEKPVSGIKTVAMDRRLLVIFTALISFTCGIAAKQVIWRDDAVKPLRVIELPPIPPNTELSLSGETQ
jgi:hypothetical protein